MYLVISFLAALIGLCFAAAAAVLPDTGVDGTIGAYLAVLGAIALLLVVGLAMIRRVSRTARRALIVVGLLTAALTALAAWFLMQDELLVAVAVSVLALIAGTAVVRDETIS